MSLELVACCVFFCLVASAESEQWRAVSPFNCPLACSHHGQCLRFGGEVRCLCYGVFIGADCSLNVTQVKEVLETPVLVEVVREVRIFDSTSFFVGFGIVFLLTITGMLVSGYCWLKVAREKRDMVEIKKQLNLGGTVHFDVAHNPHYGCPLPAV